MKPRRAMLAAALLALSLPVLGEDAAPWWERLLFNPTERTERGRAAFEEGEGTEAVERLETVRRLEADDPRARYNAGTARLAAGLDAGEELLTTALEGADAEVASHAQYNLGNARLEAQELTGAIEAYKEALRQKPDFADAKFNLELALRQKQEQEQQEQQDQEQQDQQDQEQEQEQEQKDQQDQQQEQDQNQEQQEQEQEQQEQQDQDQQDQQEQNQQEEGEEQPQDGKQERLPDFKEVPDMTAQEAAAILEAVENQERERRRQEALERVKIESDRKKDW